MSEALLVLRRLRRRGLRSIFAAGLLNCLALAAFSGVVSASTGDTQSPPKLADASRREAPLDVASTVQRPVRRVDTDDGVTVLTNSKSDPEPASPRREPVATTPLAAPEQVTLALPERREAHDGSYYASWWGALGLLVGAAALVITGWRRRQRSHRSGEPASGDTLAARTSVPPETLALAGKESAQGGTQWVSQGRPGRGVAG